MNSSEIRKKFLDFFVKRGHVVIPSASLVTSDEKGVTNSTLFNTAGMQPLIPYLLGKPHEKGTRLADVQKCLRTVDFDSIGDKTHATFFEMLGNWSLGDYFKKEAINWSYEFLTDKNEGLGLDPSRLYVTVFEGDSIAERDDEAADIWKEIFNKNKIEGNRIFYLPAENNWWQAGENGPCGPDSEMYYDVLNKFGGRGLTREEFLKADEVRDVVEVWNDVFMQYEKKDGKIIGKLPKPSVDTGAGLERLAMTLQGVDNIYDTDLLKPTIEITKNISDDIRSQRIVADHIRSSVFLLADLVLPSNTDRGYVLRRLIRKAVFNTKNRKLSEDDVSKLVDSIVGIYKDVYKNLSENILKIKDELFKESEKFARVIEDGIKEINKLKNISGKEAFILYTSFGFPVELTEEIAKKKGIEINKEEFLEELKKHQDLSRTSTEAKFKGGLGDPNDPMVVRYHTATHLLHQALFDVLGDGVGQKGSNITPERLRFDFSYDKKMTDEQKKKVEDIINEKIKARLPVNQITMSLSEAEKTGARHFFGEKYGSEISIYYIGKDMESAYSKEFCGGPHVKNTIELAGPEEKWQFKIQKEEASSQGVRRIKAVLC
jgi:alanyl-tRNA synthetase